MNHAEDAETNSEDAEKQKGFSASSLWFFCILRVMGIPPLLQAITGRGMRCRGAGPVLPFRGGTVRAPGGTVAVRPTRTLL
jgi:hypothetical protein